jgi:DNA-binding transcriptional regulator GbsR (MarR family)
MKIAGFRAENLPYKRNPKYIMPEPDMEGIKALLRETTKNFKKKPRGKTALLSQIKEELQELRKKGASAEYISELLAKKNFSVSKDTILKFLGKKKRAKKKAS